MMEEEKDSWNEGIDELGLLTSPNTADATVNHRNQIVAINNKDTNNGDDHVKEDGIIERYIQ